MVQNFHGLIERGNERCKSCLCFTFRRDVFSNNHEFIATKPCQLAISRDLFRQGGGHAHEQGITRRVPKCIVDLLEFIEIQKI